MTSGPVRDERLRASEGVVISFRDDKLERDVVLRLKDSPMSEEKPLAQRIGEGEFAELDPADFDSMKTYARARESLEDRFREAVLDELALHTADHVEEIYRTGKLIAGSDRMELLRTLGYIKRLLVEMRILPAKRRT